MDIDKSYRVLKYWSKKNSQ